MTVLVVCARLSSQAVFAGNRVVKGTQPTDHDAAGEQNSPGRLALPKERSIIMSELPTIAIKGWAGKRISPGSRTRSCS